MVPQEITTNIHGATKAIIWYIELNETIEEENIISKHDQTIGIAAKKKGGVTKHKTAPTAPGYNASNSADIPR